MSELSETSVATQQRSPHLLSRWSWRELWQGQLWPVAVALTLIIACVFALSALVVRVEKIMTDQGRSVLAADLVLVSGNPIDDGILASASQRGLTVSAQTRFGTMAFSDENMQLVSVKAVANDFPLRGNLALSSGGAARVQSQHVQPGELWLAERLFSLLAVKEGDDVMVGDAQFTVSGLIAQDPELSFNPFSQMPAVLIHYDDIARTGAVQLGGRVQYRMYFVGADDAVASFRQSIELQAGQRWISESTQGRTGDLIDRARQYLSLTLILVIIMASATLVLTCQHYTTSRRETVAMMKSLGARKAWLWRWLAGQLLMLFAFAAVLGVGLGALLETLLRLPLGDILPDPLPPMGLMPVLTSILVALLVAIPGMGISLIKLVNTPAIAVMQPEGSAQSGSGLFSVSQASPWRFGLVLVPLGALLIWFGDNTLMWLTLLGLAVMLFLLAVIGVAVVALLRKKRWGPAMQLALSRIGRSPLATGAQLAALTASLMLLAVIWLLRTDLLADWQQTLPSDAPNVFALNISEAETQPYLAALDEQNIAHSSMYPVIRGRLVASNGKQFLKGTQTQQDNTNTRVESDQEQSDEALRRELNFTWRESPPVHNKVIAGAWGGEGTVSVEQGIAERLRIQVGDELAFTVNSQPFSAMVGSIRQVEWRNMRPNFYFIFSPDVVAELPATFLVSFRIGADQSPLLNQLGRDYPTVSLMDLRIMASRIQLMLQQVSLSLSVLAALGVVSGLLLVLTLLRLGLSQRQQEMKLYRTLGASRQRISATVWSEYGMMALIAGLMATMGAEGMVAALVHFGFELSPQWHPSLWLGLPVIAVGLVLALAQSMLPKLLQPLKS
ncbi:ABC transporter permease [Photobacterium swingsii]|uniref:ABC transporter permease n=1 Tax=Photobacterium swingsii TaxID=680026 RepID=A0A0J8V905_9GAMM|nr:FtsX-like permease family protein [Photobacterium swingsii]KMV29642.1 ABC transporter permease [Photobacterium swingsii]PSW26509.1 ABC transporter permease [Photobacterium swingsii]